MSPSTTLPDLAKRWPAVIRAAAGWTLPRLAMTYVSTEHDSAEGLADKVLAAAEHGRGWARFQSAAFDGVNWRGDHAAPGKLLWAEWVDDEGVSFRVWPGPAGLRVTKRSESAKGGEGLLSALAQDVLLAGHRADRPLNYRVFWGAEDDDPAAIRRLFSRFLGFGKS